MHWRREKNAGMPEKEAAITAVGTNEGRIGEEEACWWLNVP